MTLQQWDDHGWLKKHQASRQEIDDLMAIVERNTVEYDRIGATSNSEAQELIEFVEEFRSEVISWLRRNHPKLTG